MPDDIRFEEDGKRYVLKKCGEIAPVVSVADGQKARLDWIWCLHEERAGESVIRHHRNVEVVAPVEWTDEQIVANARQQLRETAEEGRT